MKRPFVILLLIAGGMLRSRSIAAYGQVNDGFSSAPRFMDIPVEQMTVEQRKAIADLKSRYGSDTTLGPSEQFAIRVPDYLVPLRGFTDHIRSRSVLTKKLTEMVIIFSARQWTQQFVWSAHARGAINAGLDPEIVKAVAEGRRPSKMADDEGLLFDFLNELQRNQSVSDLTYSRMIATFGERGVIEAITIHGIYSYVAMMFNVGHRPLQPGEKPELAPFPR